MVSVYIFLSFNERFRCCHVMRGFWLKFSGHGVTWVTGTTLLLPPPFPSSTSIDPGTSWSTFSAFIAYKLSLPHRQKRLSKANEMLLLLFCGMTSWNLRKMSFLRFRNAKHWIPTSRIRNNSLFSILMSSNTENNEEKLCSLKGPQRVWLFLSSTAL